MRSMKVILPMIGRFVLSAVFIYAAILKMSAPQDLADSIAAYRLVPDFLIRQRIRSLLGQRLREDVRQHGGGAAGCERHDDPHGTRGIGLSPRGPRHGGRRGGGAGKAQEVTTNELHRVLLRARIVACACSRHRQKRTSVC